MLPSVENTLYVELWPTDATAMHAIVPLSQHPNASERGLVVWQDAETHDAVCAAGAGFIASIGHTGAAFADLFATEDAAVLALIQHRSIGSTPLPE
jgi:hypothetical protein